MSEQLSTPAMPKWLPAAAAMALVGVVVAAGVADALDGSSDDAGASPQPSQATVGSAGLTGAPQPTTAATTAAEAPTAILSASLSLGMTGDEVGALQQRLKDLGFDPGPVDGQFGELTRAAVWAFEKLIIGTPRSEATGVVTPSMWRRLHDDVVIAPRRPDAATVNHTEVYLPEQIVIFFRDDQPALVSHMASGTNEEWCAEVTISPGEYGNEDGTEPLVRGECGRSYTPPGVFRYNREVEGVRQTALGGLWNPIYLNYGIAIHGALNVPLEPASHGCVRIPLELSDQIQDLTELGDEVYVFDGLQEPEDVSEHDRLPVFNWRDPDWVPPTTLPPPTDPPITQPPTSPPPATAPPTRPTTTTAIATTTSTTPPTTSPPTSVVETTTPAE